MATSTGIAIATSIPSTLKRLDNGQDVGDSYQMRCLISWSNAGFRVLSINSNTEIPILAKRYPFVEFMPTDRNATAISGRPNPFVTDLLSALATQPERIVGIINSDVYLPCPLQWSDAIRHSVPNSILAGQRCDVISLSEARPQKYDDGFDFFFFERKAVDPSKLERPFALGLPWWDYWLPISFGILGYRIKVLSRPPAFHLQHPTAWEPELWDFMVLEFIESVIETAPPDPSKVTPDILALITHSKHFAVKHAQVWLALKTSFLSQREHRQQLDMALDCSWSEEFYLRANPEVNRMIRDRLYASGRDHFQMRGRLEGCAYQAPAPDVWDEVCYLKSHQEIATAVANGVWASGWDHYVRLGRYEGRRSIRIEQQQLAGLNEIARMCLTAILRDGV